MASFLGGVKAFLVLGILLGFTSSGIGAEKKSGSIRPISASGHIEDEHVQSFMKSVIQVYLLYGDYSTELDGAPNFLFLSGPDF